MKSILSNLNSKLLFAFILLSFFSKAQIITTVVGTNNNGYNGDSLQGIVSDLKAPEGGLAIDASGNLYFCDNTNQRVRKLNPTTGLLTNIAGNGTPGFSGDGGLAKQASLYGPTAVAVDKAGNVYIADYNNYRIRKVNATTGIITTIAGTGNYGPYNGEGILATSANLFDISGIAVDTAGNICFSQFGDMRVRKIDKTTGMISTLAGTGTTGYNSDNILATTAHLNFPCGIAFDKFNNLYIADKDNYRIRKVSASTGSITSVAGNGIYGGGGDGAAATLASLKEPWDVDVDSLGNILIADRYDNKIRKVDLSLNINTVAGTGTQNFSGDGGLATNAMLSSCTGVVANSCGAFYITDRGNNRIRKVSSYNFSATSTDAKCYGVCDGTVSISAIGGTSPYSFSWTGGLGSGATYTNVCAGDYITTSVDAAGCMEQLHIIINEPTPFIVSATTQTNVTCNTNGAAHISLGGGAGSPNTYVWSTSTSTASTVANLAPGTYTGSATDVNGCVATATFNILFTPTLAVTVNVTDATCSTLGSATVSATGSAPYTYTWSTGANTNTVSSLSTGSHSVTVTNANGCTVNHPFMVAYNSPTFASVPICYVTVDSLSQHNVITWDKTLYTSADSFFVYRETATNVYSKIQSQPYGELSQFVDTVRSLYFPNTGDPNIGTYRYKMKMRNVCGELSDFSLYHNTIYMTNNNGVFTWGLYSIETGTNPVMAYVLERDNLSNGTWNPIGSVAGTQQVLVDPNYSTYQATGSWRVKTLWSITCIPTQKTTATSDSYSNKIKNSTVGVKENSINNYLAIYPNPNKGIIYVSLKNTNLIGKKMTLDVFNISGEIIYTNNGEAFNDLQIDLSNYPCGMYFVKLKTDTEVSTGKIIISK